jgi:NitT/TauT family transport system substrate-binding protein
LLHPADVFEFQHAAVAPAANSLGTTPGMDTGETATDTPPPAMARRYRASRCCAPDRLGRETQMPYTMPRRTALFGLAAGATTLATTRAASAADTVRIALPTKTYFPTIITEAAVRQKLFDKEGIVAEPTVYRGGAECLEAMAAGAADVSLGGPPVVGVAIKKGVGMKLIATSSTGYMGWYLLVKADSPVTKVQDLAGKKVGITSAGSGSDFLALWTNEQYKTPFTRVPLGGGGLVPNLRGGNVDAVVLYSPLSFEMVQAKQARMLIDYSAEVPTNLAGGWVVTQKLIDEKPAVVQKTLNALYGGLNWLRNNHDAAVALIVEVDEIKPPIAEMEYTQTIMKLATDATLKPEEIQRALDMGKIIGITDTAPISQLYTTTFVPVPTT